MSTSPEIPEDSLEIPDYWVQAISFGSSFLMHLTALGLLAALVLPGVRADSSISINADVPNTVLDGNGLEGDLVSFDGGMGLFQISAPAPAAGELDLNDPPLAEMDQLATTPIMELDEIPMPVEAGMTDDSLSGAVPTTKGGKAAGKSKGAGRGQGRGTGRGLGNGSGNGMGGMGTGRGKGGFFGLKVKGKSTVFVVDASRSMNLPHSGPNETRFQRVKLELLRAVASMSENEKFFIIFFGDNAIPMPANRLMEAEVPVKKRFLTWMAQQQAVGHTFPEQALLLSLQLEPDQVYFLTDGQFDYSVVLGVTAANHEGVPIHTIGFSDDRGQNFLMEIAQRNSGTYTYIPADDPDDAEPMDPADPAAGIISTMNQ